MIYHRIYNTGATSGADITFVVVTTPSSYMIYHRICNTGATSGADITYSSGEPGAYLGFLWDSCCSTFSSVYGHNVTSNKTNIRRLHPIVGLELSQPLLLTRFITGSVIRVPLVELILPL